MDGADQDSRRPEGNGAQVAAKAIVPARESWLRRFCRVQRVKEDALLRVERAQLQLFAVLHIADGHVVVKVNRAWTSGRDVGDLNAGPRKHQHLRIGVYTQLFKQRRKVSPSIW